MGEIDNSERSFSGTSKLEANDKIGIIGKYYAHIVRVHVIRSSCNNITFYKMNSKKLSIFIRNFVVQSFGTFQKMTFICLNYKIHKGPLKNFFCSLLEAFQHSPFFLILVFLFLLWCCIVEFLGFRKSRAEQLVPGKLGTRKVLLFFKNLYREIIFLKNCYVYLICRVMYLNLNPSNCQILPSLGFILLCCLS